MAHSCFGRRLQARAPHLPPPSAARGKPMPRAVLLCLTLSHPHRPRRLLQRETSDGLTAARAVLCRTASLPADSAFQPGKEKETHSPAAIDETRDAFGVVISSRKEPGASLALQPPPLRISVFLSRSTESSRASELSSAVRRVLAFTERLCLFVARPLTTFFVVKTCVLACKSQCNLCRSAASKGPYDNDLANETASYQS